MVVGDNCWSIRQQHSRTHSRLLRDVLQPKVDFKKRHFREVVISKKHILTTPGIRVPLIADITMTPDHTLMMIFSQAVPTVRTEYWLLSYDRNWRPLAELTLNFHEQGLL